MQTRVQQWRNRDTPMTYEISLPAVGDFSAVKCGFYGLSASGLGSSKATSHDWTIVNFYTAGKDP